MNSNGFMRTQSFLCRHLFQFSQSLHVLLLLLLSVYSTNVYGVHFQPDPVVDTKDMKMNYTALHPSLCYVSTYIFKKSKAYGYFPTQTYVRFQKNSGRHN